MDVLDLDIETFSEVDLKKSNVYAYSEHPSFEIMMCGWSLNGSPVEVYDSHVEFQDRLKEIPGLWEPSVTKVAHNAGFERVCLSRYAGMRTGSYLPPHEWFDTAALAALKGLPRSLDGAAKALRVTPKDTAGTRLINLFCKPYRGRRVMPEERPEQWAEFIEYCRQDVGTMQELRYQLRDWPRDGFERDLWCLDQKINDRGMVVDLRLAAKAVDAAHKNATKDKARVEAISGVENPGSGAQLHTWLESMKADLPDLQAATVTDALSRSGIDPTVEEVLRLRQQLALVAHRKFEAVLRGVSDDGRLRGQFVYHGAHTARWSAKGAQLHNMPRLSFEYPDEEGEMHYDEVAEDIAIKRLERGHGASPETLKMLVRPMFIGPLVSSDFRSIEAIVLAWFADEQWVLHAFREGRDLYVETAGRMGGMTRGQGKIAVLASGYQGSVGTYRKMGYGGRRCPFDTMTQKPYVDPRTGREYEGTPSNYVGIDAGKVVREEEVNLDNVCMAGWEAYLVKAEKAKQPLEVSLQALREHEAERRHDPSHKCDVEILPLVRAWRAANENIVNFWYDLERKFYTGGTVGRITIEVSKSWRVIHLPSGRRMNYRGVRRDDKIVVNEDTGKKEVKRGVLSYLNGIGQREETYGGKLAENVTSACARDLLADAMLRLDAAGFPLVGHVHDEALIDYDPELHDLNKIQEIMSTPPDWATGLPMDASCTVLQRYRKD